MPSSRARYAGALARYRYSGKRKSLMSSRPSKRMRYSRPKRRGLNSNVHSFKRWATTGTANIAYPATTYSGVEKFTLDSLVSSTELTNLYDQYKINAVVVKIRLVNNPDATYMPGITSVDSSGSNYYPRLWYVRDYDDNSTLTLDEIKQCGKAKCVTLKPNVEYKIKVKPAVAMQVYRTTTTTGYAPMWPKKLDCSQSDIPHYGIKWVFDGMGVTRRSNDIWNLRFEYQYYVTMFNTR